MYFGDRVIYSQKHYAWLTRAGRWPSPHLEREERRGTITESVEWGLVIVHWDNETGTKTHFTDNLEVMNG
ncbi:MAG TPA: hypothetical protein VFH61_15930 [Thermoleophilia bacterium]|nr:hypothetical protein [Thermoleophilia bacterium]